jgi:hypothetical protein
VEDFQVLAAHTVRIGGEGRNRTKIAVFFQNSLLVYYRPTTRGVPPHNCRTPIELDVFECVSRTRHYGSNTNQLLTKYPFTTGSLAFSLALKTSLTRMLNF